VSSRAETETNQRFITAPPMFKVTGAPIRTLEKTFSQMGAFFTVLECHCQGNSFLLAKNFAGRVNGRVDPSTIQRKYREIPLAVGGRNSLDEWRLWPFGGS
jgi:hypothetical protein